jgi:hypothetical protein
MQTEIDGYRTESGRVLDPQERSSEVLFGLIMVLTFTCTLSVATSSREDVREMFVGAVGCNVAWGIVDGVMYLTAILVARGRTVALARAVRSTTDGARARAYVLDALPEGFERVVDDAQLDVIVARARGLTDPVRRAALRGRDFAGALGVLLLVSVGTLPVVLPFLLVEETWRAMRWSNAVAIVMLFGVGWLQAGWGGLRRLPFALAMVAIGLVLVAATIALGG